MKKLFALVALLFAAPAFATDPQFGAIRIEAAPDIRHAFVSTKNQGADSSKVSVSEWNAAHVAPATLIASVPTGFVWPAQPAAVTEFCGASTGFRWRANLASYSTIRLTAQVIGAGAATAALRLQYTTDTTGASGWDYLDSVSGPSVTINATGVTVSASVSIATAAKADVLLRLVGINGDGAGGAACYSTIKAATATLADSATSATSASTASALSANGANCAIGSAPLGVDASGAVEGCFAVPSGTGTVSGTNTGDQTTITGNAGTATALAANGANCSAGSYPLGVDASGAAESCTVAFSAAVASGPTYCADAGASDAYACNLSPAPASYAAIIGVPLTFKANTVNTGAATINFNSLGAAAIVKVGATTTTALVTNDIRAGSLVTVQWDGSNFECLSCMGNYANLAIANTWTGAQSFPQGASGAPSVAFSSGTTTGFYNRGANRITVTAVGYQLLEFDSSGSYLGSGGHHYFLSGALGTGTDVSLTRYAAGVLRVTNGTTGIGVLLGGGASVASATAMPVPTGNVFHVTGTTTITSITSTNFVAGTVITLIFDGILTFTDGGNLKLAGNFVTTADDTITLVYDGTNWYEVARSVN